MALSGPQIGFYKIKERPAGGVEFTAEKGVHSGMTGDHVNPIALFALMVAASHQAYPSTQLVASQCGFSQRYRAVHGTLVTARIVYQIDKGKSGMTLIVHAQVGVDDVAEGTFVRI